MTTAAAEPTTAPTTECTCHLKGDPWKAPEQHAKGCPERERASAPAFSVPAEVRLIKLEHLRLSSTNPRKSIDQAELQELADSIRRQGILQPLLVRPMPGTPASGPFEIVFGERRFRAAKLLGLEAVPCAVRKLDDVQVLEIQIVENNQREDVHQLDEAEGYRQLIAKGHGYDARKLAAHIGRSEKYVWDRLKLLGLTKKAQQLFRDGRITAGHAILLARLTHKDQERIIATPRALFVPEYSLTLHYDDDKHGRASDDGTKAVSVRELDAYIDEHVRLDVQHADAPVLFPEMVAKVTKATEQAATVLHITHLHYVAPEAKAGKDAERIYFPQSWTRADGRFKSKKCDSACTGVVVVGPGRGEAFDVCIEKKKCAVHYGREIRAAKQRAANPGTSAQAKQAEAQKREQAKQAAQAKADELMRTRWRKARPELLKATAAAVRKASAGANGPLAAILVRESHSRPGGLVKRGTSADDLVRFLAYGELEAIAGSEWMGPRNLPAVGRTLGVDVAAILDKVAPLPAPPAKPKDVEAQRAKQTKKAGALVHRLHPKKKAKASKAKSKARR